MVLLYFACSLHGGVWRSVASDVSAPSVSDKHIGISAALQNSGPTS